MRNLIDLINADTWNVASIDISDDNSQFYLNVLDESTQYKKLIFDIQEDIKKDSSFKSNLLDTLVSKYDVCLPSAVSKVLHGNRDITSDKNGKQIAITYRDTLDYTPLYSEVLQDSVEQINFCGDTFGILKDLNFISSYQKLKKINLSNSSMNDFPPLNSKSLQSSVEELDLQRNILLSNIKFLKDYKKLKKLNLKLCPEVKDYSALGSESLQSTIKELSITPNENLSNLEFIKNYKKLQKLVLNGCSNIDDFSPLGSKSLQSTIEELDLSGNENLSNLEFIKDYKKLQKFTLSDLNGMGSALDCEFLQSTIKELDLSTSVNFSNVEFLKNYKKLQKLDISFCSDLEDYSALGSKSLQSTIKILDLGHNENLSNLEFLKNYKKLQGLSLSFCSDLEDYSALGSRSLQSTIKILDLGHNENLSNLEFLKNYKKLQMLNLSNCPGVEDYSALGCESLQLTIEGLGLSNTKLSNLEFLGNYRKLRGLDISSCSDVEDYSALGYESLQSTVEELDLSNTKLSNLEFLGNYRKLRALDISSCSDVENYSALGCESLQSTIKDLDLSGNENLSNLKFLKNYKILQYLKIKDTGIKNIYSLLDCKFVKNGNLKELSLSDTIDWTKIKNNRFINSEAMLKLRKAGIEVRMDGEFSYNPKYPDNEALLNSIINQFELDEDLIEIIKFNLDSTINQYLLENNGNGNGIISECTQGRVAHKVAKIGEKVYKITSPKNFHREYSVYASNLGAFDNFKPKLQIKEKVCNNQIGILAIENIDKKTNKFQETCHLRKINEMQYDDGRLTKERKKIEKRLNKDSYYLITKDNDDNTAIIGNSVKQEGALDLYDYIDHFMYVIGLFHSNKAISLDLAPPRHKVSNGETYIDAINDVPNNDFNHLLDMYGFRLYDCQGILKEIQKGIEENAYCPIIGDFKKNNTTKGYIIDYDRIRLGNPVEDIAKFLEQSEFGLTSEEKTHFVKKYFVHRQNHDESFTQERANHIIDFYNHQALYENLRVLSGKCCWNQNLNDSYYKSKVTGALGNVTTLASNL